MKKIIDFITEKAMEREDNNFYNVWKNLVHQTEPHQQENIIVDLLNYLYLQNKYILEDQLFHRKICPFHQIIKNPEYL